MQLAKYVPCFAHTINLIVKQALKPIQDVVAKVKAIVEYVHRSTVASERLRATQLQMGLEPLKIKQDVTTRWNSTFYMLQRVLDRKDAIISTLALVNPNLTTLTRFVTASKVILMARGLHRVVQRIHGGLSTPGRAVDMVNVLLSEIPGFTG